MEIVIFQETFDKNIMTGDVNETYLSDLHSRTTDEQQSSFTDFVDDAEEDDLGTTIAVVSDPTGGIVDASDEFIPELGMPENELNNFRRVRNNINVDDDVKRHNKAVDITNIDEKYDDYVSNDPEAQEKISELVERVRDGENITFVCFEKEPKWCHRHSLVEKLENELSN